MLSPTTFHHYRTFFDVGNRRNTKSLMWSLTPPQPRPPVMVSILNTVPSSHVYILWTHAVFHWPVQTAAMEVDAKCSSFLSSLTAGADRVTHGLWASVWDRAKFKFWKKSEHPAMAQISLGSWTWMPFSNPSWLSRATLALWSCTVRACAVE